MTGRLGAVSAALLGAAGAVVSVVVAPTSAERLTDVALALVIWTYAGVGVLIAWRHPGHRVGTCVLAGAAIWGVSGAALDVAVSRLRDGHDDVGTRLAATLGDAGRGLGWFLLILVLPLLFPDGRPAGTPRVRRVAWSVTAFAISAFFLAGLLAPTSNDLRIPEMDNPIGLPRSWEPVNGLVSVAGALAAAVGVVLAVVTLVQRWRRDDDLARQRVLWFALAFACPVVLFPIGLADDATPLMFALATLPVPIAIAVAVTQRRLYDVQLAVNRSLTYGVLSVLIAGLYAVVVGGVGAFTRSRGAPWLPWVAAGVVAVSFAPLRNALQQGANRLTYGQWSQPADVLAATGRRLADAADVPALLQTLAAELGTGLGLASVEITDSTGRTLARQGVPGSTTEELPLTAYGTPVGVLRWSGGRLRAPDRALLTDVAHQLGGVVHAAALLDVVRTAQERQVLAREEERKRLRRDLHDGLGPALAALTLHVDALRNRLDAPEVDAELLRLRSGIQGTVSDVRRIVEGLRPPALDELGLAGAMEQLADRLTAGTELLVDVRVADRLEPAAAVEVAAYRIAQEALTNVVRHAHAHQACVRVAADDGELVLEVRDDGTGTPAPRDGGVGLASMRERAEELGGRVEVAGRPGVGTRVVARLPVDATRTAGAR
ncbi:MAG TPA: sensor histidine kinase [Blastococcus sp.]|nr:sensor histidine kinase [Blastococcus sp.]